MTCFNIISQEPNFSQNTVYGAKSLALSNPSLVGINDNWSLLLMNKRQWDKIPSKFHTYVASLENHFCKIPFALGVSFLQNTEGENFLKTSDFQTSFSYDNFLKIFKNDYLNFGLGYQLRFSSISVDWSNVTFMGNFDPVNGYMSYGNIDFPTSLPLNSLYHSVGTYIRYINNPSKQNIAFLIKHVDLGFSINNIGGTELGFFDNSINNSGFINFPTKITFHGNIEYFLNQKSIYNTFFYQRSGPLSTLQIGLIDFYSYPFNFNFSYRHQSSGLSNFFQNRESIIASLGYKKSDISFYLTYDIVVSQLNGYTNNVLEFSIILESGGLGIGCHNPDPKIEARKRKYSCSRLGSPEGFSPKRKKVKTNMGNL